MPRKRRPDPDQQELDYKSRRGLELQALRRIDLDDPFAKIILLALDLTISQERGCWDMTREDLRRICNMKRTAFYDRLKKLQQLQLISIEALPNSAKERWRIYRGTVARLASNPDEIECRQADAVRVADGNCRQADETVRVADGNCRQANESVRQADCTTYGPSGPITDPPAPTGPGGDVDGWLDLRQELIDLGVIRWDKTLAELHQRVTLDHARKLLAHFREHAESRGWQPVTLYFRAQRARWDIAPEANWPAQSASTSRTEPQPAVDLEARHGAPLDALTLDQLRELVRNGDDVLRSMAREIGLERLRSVSDARRKLLLLLATSEDAP